MDADFSFRIAKGVYYRIGGFAGTPIETTQRIYVDTGPFAVTNKHVYFGGTKKPRQNGPTVGQSIWHYGEQREGGKMRGTFICPYTTRSHIIG
jgi:hypothetical protein